MISKKVFISTIVLIFVGFLFMGAVTRFYAVKFTPQSGDTYGIRVYDATGTTPLFGINKSGNFESHGEACYDLTESGQTALSNYYRSGVSVTPALMRLYSTFTIDATRTGVTKWTDGENGFGKSGLTVVLPTVESDMDGHIYRFMNMAASGTTRFYLYGTAVYSSTGTTNTVAPYTGTYGSCLVVMAKYLSGVSWIILQPPSIPTS